MAVSRIKKIGQVWGSGLKGGWKGFAKGLSESGNPINAALQSAAGIFKGASDQYNNGEPTYQKVAKQKMNNGNSNLIPNNLQTPQSKDPNIAYNSKYTPQQLEAMDWARRTGLEGLQKNPHSFENVRNNALRNFEQYEAPGIRSSLTKAGVNRGDSAWDNAVTGARANLESNIAAQEIGYGQWQQDFFRSLLDRGLGEQFEPYAGTNNNEQDLNAKDWEAASNMLSKILGGYNTWKQNKNSSNSSQSENTNAIGAPQGLQSSGNSENYDPFSGFKNLLK